MTSSPRAHWLLPEGIEEVLPTEAAHLERLRRRLLDLFASWGYELVMPPFIDYLESLLTGTGHDLDLQTFKLTDQASGRLLGVRADMTPQVARIDAHNLRREGPTRLCYIGTVLHTRGDHLEKSRSPLQVGAELYGHAGVASDVEVIRLMLEMLAVSGVLDVHLDLGHVGVFRTLARQAELSAEAEATLFDALQRKALPELTGWLETLGVTAALHDMLLALPELNGHPEVVLDAARQRLAPAGEPVARALDALAETTRALGRIFPALPLNLDLAELRGYRYQTGVVFAAFVPGYGKEIARGGRYDEIGKVFGRARPATGFSADLKILSRLAVPEAPPPREAILAPLSDDPGLHDQVRKLRAAGRVVVEALPEQDNEPAALGCAWVLRPSPPGWEIAPVDDQGASHPDRSPHPSSLPKGEGE